MNQGSWAVLDGRGVVAVSGTDARPFLQDVVTTNIDRVEAGAAGYGGLLTPQGKVLVDFLVFFARSRFLFDVSRSLAPELARRLGFYKLRAQVEVADLSQTHAIAAFWGPEEAPVVAAAALAPDPRLAALGWRGVFPADSVPDSVPGLVRQEPAAYDAHRIALGVPEGGADFAFGDAFPHDADMDQLGGIDFRKGCYVGQEVVSRMEHRGTARRRIVTVKGEGLQPGAAVEADGRSLGTIGSVADGAGLALLRLDRTREALDAGLPITAGGTMVDIALPGWARFGWPRTGEEG